MTSMPLLQCQNLHLSVRTPDGPVQILKGVDLDLKKGEVLGVAGESGSGKSTLIKAILGILPPGSRIDTGAILLDGQPLTDAMSTGAGRMQRRSIGFIPQDPYLALNPQFRIGTQMMEILRWNGMPGEEPRRITFRERPRFRAYLAGLLQAVKLPDPEDALERYPHQFSGGQRQRILIASALASRPRVLLADEPTTALDVTTQQQILLLLQDLVEQFDTSLLFVTHDFGVISQLCDRVAVMLSGQIVECGDTRQIIDAPAHAYTRNLIDAHPGRQGMEFLQASARRPQ